MMCTLRDTSRRKALVPSFQALIENGTVAADGGVAMKSSLWHLADLLSNTATLLKHVIRARQKDLFQIHIKRENGVRAHGM